MTTTQTTSDEIVYRDPNELVAHPANVRTNLGNLDAIAKSISQVGILEPIILVPTEHGEVILAGHRRAAAAVKAGESTVPCILRPDLAGEIDALTAMVIENVHREGLATTEQAHAYEQLSAFGLSATAIAKRTGVGQTQIKKHFVVAGSDLALAAGERYQFLTLDHLATLAEFEDDREAVKELTLTAKDDPDYFAHCASRLRQERVRNERRAAAVESLAAAGVNIVDDPGWSYRGPMERVSNLLDEKGKKITDRAHANCAGHVAVVSSYDPEQISYWCSDPSAYGHTSTIFKSTSKHGERDIDGKLTERARAERRRVIDNNKAMEAVTPVRRAFVQGLIAKKSTPKGVLRYAVADLASYPHGLSTTSDGVLATLVDIEADGSGGYSHVVGPKAVSDATDARLANVLFGLVAGSIESNWPKDVWRAPNARTIGYLNFLAIQGYRLADVEQEMVDSAAGSDDSSVDASATESEHIS